jgi:hypothetical protein
MKRVAPMGETSMKPGRERILSTDQQNELSHMQVTPIRARAARQALTALAVAMACANAGAASPADASHGIEQALSAAQQDKRGITVYVSGQAIGGAVTRIEPGQWVELKNQTFSKIIVRIDRIDGIAAP